MATTSEQISAIFSKARNANVAIVDVRTHDELKQITISGAIHIPLDELPNRITELKGFDEVYFFCHAGKRADIACQIAQQSGIVNACSIQSSIFEIYEHAHKI